MSSSIPAPTNRADYLDAIRGVAIVLVVAIHTASYLNTKSPIIHFFISNIALTIAVPIFFIVDGFLFNVSANKSASINYFNFASKSVTRLIAPWLVFAIVYLIARFIAEKVGLLDSSLSNDLNIQKFVESLYYSIYANQLYFLLSLFLIRLSLFHILIILKQSPISVFCLFVFVHVSFTYTDFFKIGGVPNGGLDPITHAAWGAQFYILGFFIRSWNYHKLTHKNILLTLSFYSLIILVSFLFGILPSIFFSLIFLLLAEQFNFNASWMTGLGKRTLGIYLLHAPILVFLTTKLLAPLSIADELKFITVVILLTSSCFLLSKIISSVKAGRLILGN